MKKTLFYIGILSFAILLGLSIGYVHAGWTEPSLPPPQGNISAPLNIGAISQYKEGGLLLGFGGPSVGLIVAGPTKVGIVVTGTVAIGVDQAFVDDIPTMAPMTEKLRVGGQIRITGGLPDEGKVLTSDANGLARWENSGGGFGNGRMEFYLPGFYYWYVPASVTSIKVEVWGGGGGGGAFGAGGGGGGGGYAQKIISTSPGTRYGITIGAGGSRGSNGGIPADGFAGADSRFVLSLQSINLIAGGGRGGAKGPNGRAGGRGGGAAGGSVNIAGTNGENGVWTGNNDHRAGNGGYNPKGGSPGYGGSAYPPFGGDPSVFYVSIAGVTPGGGGGGGGTTGDHGGNGGDGKVVVSW